MEFLPIFLDLRGRRCIVVGGGAVAERKLSLLLSAHAQVSVIAPAVSAALEARARAGEIEILRREFAPADVAEATLVIAATDDAGLNEAVAAAVQAAGGLVNAVDQPNAGNVIMPSIVDRSPVVIAIGTSGNAPVLARMLRAKLESMIPQAYGELATLLGSVREKVRLALPDLRTRRRFWEQALDGPAPELMFAGRRQDALAAIERLLARQDTLTPPAGEVFLVGTGPGDPDLLTFRALRLMQSADVVIYDRLVSAAVVDLCRRDAERIFVGKGPARHSVVQADINELLISLARSGKRVARLKGGDPFMFGRGGEEIEDLAAAGIDFQVVPGITAALGCAAYAGIPLTHRDLAHSCIFVTAHQREGGFALNWSALVQAHQTLVVYMGVATLASLCEKLLSHGMAADMPAALIERGTLPSQRVLCASVSDIAQRAAAMDVQAPALLIVGQVVKLRERLDWFDAPGVRFRLQDRTSAQPS